MPKTNKKRQKKEQKQVERQSYVLGRLTKCPDLVDFLKKCGTGTYEFYLQTDYDYYYDYGYQSENFSILSASEKKLNIFHSESSRCDDQSIETMSRTSEQKVILKLLKNDVIQIKREKWYIPYDNFLDNSASSDFIADFAPCLNKKIDYPYVIIDRKSR